MPKMFEAGGTIRVARFVKIGAADHVILEADANEKTLGISQEGGRTAPIPDVSTDPPEAAQSGEQTSVYTMHKDDGCLLFIGSGGVTRGDEIESDANGAGVTAGVGAATVRNVGAVALESASASEYCRVMLVHFKSTIPA